VPTDSSRDFSPRTEEQHRQDICLIGRRLYERGHIVAGEGNLSVRLDGNRILPFHKYGIRVMSLGFILETDTPVIWRGPMVMRAIEQMLGDVEWGTLDYLILDLPPGTGDAQLTVTQKVPLASCFYLESVMLDYGLDGQPSRLTWQELLGFSGILRCARGSVPRSRSRR